MQSIDVPQSPDIIDDPSDKSDDDSGLSLVIADTSQIIAVIRGPELSLTLSSSPLASPVISITEL